jgi:hypothetical protein
MPQASARRMSLPALPAAPEPPQRRASSRLAGQAPAETPAAAPRPPSGSQVRAAATQLRNASRPTQLHAVSLRLFPCLGSEPHERASRVAPAAAPRVDGAGAEPPHVAAAAAAAAADARSRAARAQTVRHRLRRRACPAPAHAFAAA